MRLQSHETAICATYIQVSHWFGLAERRSFHIPLITLDRKQFPLFPAGRQFEKSPKEVSFNSVHCPFRHRGPSNHPSKGPSTYMLDYNWVYCISENAIVVSTLCAALRKLCPHDQNSVVVPGMQLPKGVPCSTHADCETEITGQEQRPRS